MALRGLVLTNWLSIKQLKSYNNGIKYVVPPCGSGAASRHGDWRVPGASLDVRPVSANMFKLCYTDTESTTDIDKCSKVQRKSQLKER